ncbi:MAG: TerB family tellurite resistance protein [Anderseniella sp.]
MTIWTTITEILQAVGDSVSEALSRIVGAPREKRDPQKSVAFTIGVVALSAKMAKADGLVSEAEIAAFREIFVIHPDETQNVARVFNLAKQEVTGFDSYARQIARLFRDQKEVLEDLIDGLFHIARADGAVGEQELAFLEEVSRIFGLEDRFGCIRSRNLRGTESDPYSILGIDCDASDGALKEHYRKLVRENHPDRHIAAGMPEEAVAIATTRLARINEAWGQVERERGI